jgi:hypothetical protein
MCCKLLSIPELDKPQQKWCQHCEIGVGCNIYDEKPPSCSAFYCGYLLNDGIDEHWKPSTSKMVLDFEQDSNRIVIHVDSCRLHAWRKEPYYSEIKGWAVAAAQNRGQVIVWQGNDAVAILPDREKNLGPVRADQFIITSQKTGPLGIELDVLVVEKDDPRLGRLENQ